MDANELLCAFRQDAVDDVTPYLWTDPEVYRYINDAYFMFVRLTGGIADGSSAVTQLIAVADEPTTPIDPSVMRIRTAHNITDNNRPIKVINVQDEDYLTSDDYGIVRSISQVDSPGPVRYMIIGEEEDYVRWVQVPTEDTTIQLVIERLPLQRIERPKDKFTGVREEHHYHLLKWVRHLAYRKQDADTFNLIKSDQERDDFVAYCELAKREKSTRKHKVRVTRYGGL